MKKCRIDELAITVMEGLEEYASLANSTMKESVQKAAKTAKKEIEANAPVDTGAYKKSWAIKKTKESANTLECTVHSKNRYQLAHLLEHGHAKRGGGRVEGKPHIAPAEQKAIKQLEEDIERGLK